VEVIIWLRDFEIRNYFVKCRNMYVFEGSRSKHLVWHTKVQQGSERKQSYRAQSEIASCVEKDRQIT